MTSTMRNKWVALAMVCACAVFMTGTAHAVDAPKWVAALYVEAQKPGARAQPGRLTRAGHT